MENLEPATSAAAVVALDDASALLASQRSNSSNSSASSSSSSSSDDAPNGDDAGGETNGRTSSEAEEPMPLMMPPPPPAVSTLCRICMCDPAEDGRTLESLFRTTVESKTLYAMLVSVCAPLGQVNNDGMPDKVCTGCKNKLVQAYKLYETCVKSDDRLRKLLQLQNSAGGVLIKQEIIDDDDEDVELANVELYYDTQVKKEDQFDQDYLFDGGFYGVGLAAATYNTPNLRIQSVHNGPEVLVQLQEQDSPPKPAFEWDKYVKVTPKGHNCILCGKDFKYFSYFKQHAMAQHDPTKPHKCVQCKYTFKTEQRLFIHMRTHLEQAEELPLAIEHAELPEPELEIDGVDLDQSDDIPLDEESVSVSINPDNGEKIYTCLICQKQLTTLPLYRRHQTVHTVRGRPFECEICHYRFAMKFSYNAHMLRHEQGKDPAQPASYKCTECDELFPRRKLLNLHVTLNHEKPTVYLNKTAPAAILTSNISDGRGGHACPICSETFNRESVLNNHMKTHELEAAQLKHSEICYICNVCGVECETRESFTTHIKTHGDDVQFDANNTLPDVPDLDDDEDPTQSSNAQNGAEDPLSTSTPSKPEPKAGIRCELCSKTFPYACNLKQHRIIHHSELKPHECHICHYRFEYEGTLMRHMQKHSKQELSAAAAAPVPPLPATPAANEDPIVAPAGSSIIYKCKLCSARFQKQKSMTWHLKTHRSIVAGEAAQEKEQSPTKSIPSLDESPLSPSSASAANAFAARLDLKPQQQQQQNTSAMQQIQQLQQAAMRAAGGGAGPKMYKCGYCPQKLDSEDAYYQHLKGHRVRPAPSDPLQPDEETPPAKKKRSWVRSGEHHKCHLCQKVFTFRSQLQQHTALHHQPGKPYECGKCHYSFVHKLNLKRHELTHLEEERVASEDDPSMSLLEDESFNADIEELVEPVLDEMNPSVVGLMPVNRNTDATNEKQSGESSSGGPPKRNKCVVCSAMFQREDQLIEHLKTHIERMKVTKQETQSAKKILSAEDDRKCKLCAKVFKFSCQLKQHIQMHHSKDKPFECNICRYRFEFKGHMIRHKAINHADEMAAEEAEADELPTKITTPTVNPDGSEVYQCPVCPINFAKQRSLTWHLKTHTSKKPKREDGYPSTSQQSSGEVFHCRVCTRMFRDVYELKAHMLTHASSGAASGQSSSTAPIVEADHSLFGSGLDMMLQDFPDTMEDTDPLFDGSNLELVLEDNFDNDLDFSMRYSHQDTPPLPPAKRSAPAAGGNESSVYDVAEPGASTTPAKGKIVCELCKKDFLYSCNLKQHMQLHHAKEKPFECKICFYRFEYSGHLVRHIRTNHDNQQEDAIGDAIERNFVCTFCSELFEQKTQLNSHIQTYHKGEKQFKCDMCPASFAYKKTYENHREEHHSIKPGEPSTVAPAAAAVAPMASAGPASFSCNFCKKTFSSAQKVDNHVCFQ